MGRQEVLSPHAPQSSNLEGLPEPEIRHLARQVGVHRNPPFVASQGSKLLHEEQHKGHEVYTSSGHHCGVIPYSSLWSGGLPLGLMMNNTRKNSLARVCSCGLSLFGRPDRSISVPCGWLVLFIGEGPEPLPKY